MTSTTERYRAAASQSAGTVEKIADVWTQGSQKLSDYMLPGLPQIDLVPVVEHYFEFVQRTMGIVNSNSIVPTRRSSAHSRMPTAGTRNR